MDPWTGEILAMANEPTFNPNAFAAVAEKELLKNRAVQDIYEPGSTFKIVTASAALQENVIKPTDVIDVSQGLITIGSRRVRDTHRYGPLTFEDVIVKSSNVGAIKVGFRVGPERLGRYVRRFGFGSVLSPDLRGESPGIVWSQLNDSALASVSMGYQIGVTPLQMVTAASSVANGGRLMEPHLVRAIIRDGRRTAVQPKVLRETITLDTAAELTTIMEGVVERGTAKAARVDGFTIAGKDRHRRQAGTRRVLEVRVHVLVCRLPAVPQAGRHDSGRHRLAAPRRAISAAPSRPRCSSGLRRPPSGISACPARSTPTRRCS